MIVTNGTHWNEKFVEQLKSLTDLDIRISLDDIYERNNYQREGSNFDVIEKNFIKFSTNFYGKIMFNCTMNWYNIYHIDEFLQYADDFNTPILIAHLFEGVKFINQIKEDKESITIEDLLILSTTMNVFVFDVLGLLNDVKENSSDKIDGVVTLLIKLRKEARENKDWVLSDQIRDELLILGIQLKDGREGTTYSMN